MEASSPQRVSRYHPNMGGHPRGHPLTTTRPPGAKSKFQSTRESRRPFPSSSGTEDHFKSWAQILRERLMIRSSRNTFYRPWKGSTRTTSHPLPKASTNTTNSLELLLHASTSIRLKLLTTNPVGRNVVKVKQGTKELEVVHSNYV